MPSFKKKIADQNDIWVVVNYENAEVELRIKRISSTITYIYRQF